MTNLNTITEVDETCYFSAPYLELSTNCISREFDKSIDNVVEKTTRYKKFASLYWYL